MALTVEEIPPSRSGSMRVVGGGGGRFSGGAPPPPSGGPLFAPAPDMALPERVFEGKNEEFGGFVPLFWLFFGSAGKPRRLRAATSGSAHARVPLGSAHARASPWEPEAALKR